MAHKLRWFFLLAEIFWSAVSLAQTPAKMPDWSTYVTNAAVKSGNASDPTVWAHPPVDGDWLGIPVGTTVAWDLQACPQLQGIYNVGTIDAGQSPGNLVINAGTVFTGMGGLFKAGHCNPAGADTPLIANTLTVTFLDIAPDPMKDPGQFGTGFLVMGGMVDICGSENKDSWLITSACHKGDTTITLRSVPNDWNPGDQLVVPGVYLSPVQDEVVVVQSVTSNIVTLSAPLAYDHVPAIQPQGQANILPVGNLTRRITFKSANPSGTRGHCMFMQDMGMPSNVCVCHVAVKDCGRTLATQPVTDPMVDANGVLVPGTAANPRARYAWHSHRQGQAANALQNWDGMAVWGATKWCYDNHDSNVNATNLLGYNAQGAIFATERGSEIGTYTNCLGVRTSGTPASIANLDAAEFSRMKDEDFGWFGSGLWLQGPGVTAIGNVLCGHPAAGTYISTPGASRFGSNGSTLLANTFNRALLPTGFTLLNPNADPLVVQVPLFGCSDNISFGCATGHLLDWNLTDTTQAFQAPLGSTVTGPVSWNCPVGLLLGHTGNVIVDSPIWSGPNCAVGSFGLNGGPSYVVNTTLKSPQIGGFETGVNMQLGHTVSDGFYSNVWDFLDNLPNDHQVVFSLTGSPVFVAPTAAQLAGRQPLNFKMGPYVRYFFDLVNLANVNDWFYPVTYYLPGGLELFKQEQSPTFVPIPASDPNVAIYPPALIGLTNTQIKAQYGMCVGDKVAGGSPVATPPYTTNGIIATAQATRPFYVFGGGTGSNYSVTTASYNLQVYDFAHQSYYTDPTVTALQSGWNALTRTIGGQEYTFWVQLKGTPPQPSSTTTTVQAAEAALRPVTCTVKIVASNGTAVSEGIATLSATGALSVQCAVANGTATGTILLPPGTDTVTATYSGGPDFQGSVGVVTITVQ